MAFFSNRAGAAASWVVVTAIGARIEATRWRKDAAGGLQLISWAAWAEAASASGGIDFFPALERVRGCEALVERGERTPLAVCLGAAYGSVKTAAFADSGSVETWAAQDAAHAFPQAAKAGTWDFAPTTGTSANAGAGVVSVVEAFADPAWAAAIALAAERAGFELQLITLAPIACANAAAAVHGISQCAAALQEGSVTEDWAVFDPAAVAQCAAALPAIPGTAPLEYLRAALGTAMQLALPVAWPLDVRPRASKEIQARDAARGRWMAAAGLALATLVIAGMQLSWRAEILDERSRQEEVHAQKATDRRKVETDLRREYRAVADEVASRIHERETRRFWVGLWDGIARSAAEGAWLTALKLDAAAMRAPPVEKRTGAPLKKKSEAQTAGITLVVQGALHTDARTRQVSRAAVEAWLREVAGGSAEIRFLKTKTAIEANAPQMETFEAKLKLAAPAQQRILMPLEEGAVREEILVLKAALEREPDPEYARGEEFSSPPLPVGVKTFEKESAEGKAALLEPRFLAERAKGARTVVRFATEGVRLRQWLEALSAPDSVWSVTALEVRSAPPRTGTRASGVADAPQLLSGRDVVEVKAWLSNRSAVTP